LSTLEIGICGVVEEVEQCRPGIGGQGIATGNGGGFKLEKQNR
jgi:hypothetical protein